jgi:DNA-3-methyladenine glycosylase I
MAQYKENKIEELLLNSGIVRHKQKIRAAISNAQAFIKIQEEFGSFNSFIWAFVKRKPIQNKRKQMSEITATSDLSDKLSKELKKRGFKFVGSKVIYAFMQATGMVNDHTIDCFRYAELKNNESD